MEQEEEYTKFSAKKKNCATQKKKKGSESIKRFSDEQVKSLESIFGQGTKLEPRKKMEVARDLGLQPRQVSIWFQNKRARWKSKQMEQEYRLLNDSFDALNQQFESLKKENQSLLDQIQKLRSQLENINDTRNSIRIENGKQISDEIKENDDHRALYSDEDEIGIDDKYLRKIHKREEEKQFLNMSESDHEWCNLPSPRSDRWPELLNDSCGPSGWWNLSEL